MFPNSIKIICPLSRLQTDYAHEFTIFKPDKKLKWLPHLGTVQLELRLEDRVVDVDVPPLEAAFIELFSEKGAVYSALFCLLNIDWIF